MQNNESYEINVVDRAPWCFFKLNHFKLSNLTLLKLSILVFFVELYE